jgi:hypothetical protein
VFEADIIDAGERWNLIEVHLPFCANANAKRAPGHSVVIFLSAARAASIFRRYHSRAQADAARTNLQAGFPRVIKIQDYF